jgi:hypothetical protein
LLTAVPQIWSELYQRFENHVALKFVENNLPVNYDGIADDPVRKQIINDAMKDAYPWLGGRVKVRC